MQQRDEGIAWCKAVSGLSSTGRSASSGTSAPSGAPKAATANSLSQQVLKIETESPSSAAFCFHPFKALLTTVDLRGVVRVLSYQSGQAPDVKQTLDARSIVNRFHIARGDPAQVFRTAEVTMALSTVSIGMCAAFVMTTIWLHQLASSAFLTKQGSLRSR